MPADEVKCWACGLRRAASEGEPPPGWCALGGDPEVLICETCAALARAIQAMREADGDPRPPAPEDVRRLRAFWRRLSKRPLLDLQER